MSYFLLLCSFKALLWAIGRSALASKQLTAPQFAAILLTPLTPVSGTLLQLTFFLLYYP